MPTRLSTPVSTGHSRHPSPTANFSVPLSHSLTGVPFLLPVTLRSQVQNPLSGFAPKQTKESSAWRTTYIVLQYILILSLDLQQPSIYIYIYIYIESEVIYLCFTNPDHQVNSVQRKVGPKLHFIDQNLCMVLKPAIASYNDPNELHNQKSEMLNVCWHKNV